MILPQIYTELLSKMLRKRRKTLSQFRLKIKSPHFKYKNEVLQYVLVYTSLLRPEN